MAYSRRDILKGLAAAPAIVGVPTLVRAADARVIKISPQFPGGTIDTGDFRDRLMRKGALDMSLYPLAYAGGEVQELNIGLMPCMVTSYEQGFAWKKAEVGRELVKLLDAKGVKMVTWIWQAGGTASRLNPVVEPGDVKGLKVRGGSREMDLMLKEAGGIISSVPSNEIYAAMQTGSLDAAVTSSTSLISFRLEEISKGLTTGRGKSFWYMLEPLLMSKSVFDSLTPAQQKAVLDVGTELESFATASAKLDDDAVAAVYKKAGAKVADMDDAILGRWRKIAEAAAWPDFSNRNADCERFLKMAKAVA